MKILVKDIHVLSLSNTLYLVLKSQPTHDQKYKIIAKEQILSPAKRPQL